MIKLSKHFYIHWLTVALFAGAYITRTLGATAAVYAVMLMHELAHTAAAAYLKLGISHIAMYPFGATLKIRSRMLCSLADAVILYLSGPLINATAALLCAVFDRKGLFYYNNIFLFILNILPVLPLDGGQLAEYILSSKFGYKNAAVCLKISAIIFSCLFASAFWLYGSFNLNTVTFCLFIIGGIFTQKAKYSRDFLRELSFAGKGRDCVHSDLFVAKQDYPPRQLIRRFNPSKGAVVVFTDEKGKILRAATDTEIVSEIIQSRQ